jgi:hypothetical protein
MAKVSSPIIEIQGQLGNLVFVNSKIYGGHIRQPRGTHTKAVLNSTFQQNADNAALVTRIAKSLHQVFKVACGAFKQRDLWQVMMRRMFKVTLVTAAELIKSLDGLEMNAGYPLHAIIAEPQIATHIKGKQLIITIQHGLHVHFADKLEADSYCLELTIIWMSKECDRQETSAAAIDWMPVYNSTSAFELTYDKPVWATYYLLLLKVQGGKESKDIERFKAMGMRVVGVGEL